MRREMLLTALVLLLLAAGCAGRKGEAPEAGPAPSPAEPSAIKEEALALEMRKGLEYTYLVRSAGGELMDGEVHLFVTGEDGSAWEGTAVRYGAAEPAFVKFRLEKEGLELTFSKELGRGDLGGEPPLSGRPQLNPILYPLLVPYIQTQYGVSIEDLSGWAVRLEGREGSAPITLSLLGPAVRYGYDTLELKLQASDTDQGIQIYASASEPHLLVEAGSGEEHWEGTSMRLIDVQEREFSIEDLAGNESRAAEELERQVQQLQEELRGREGEIEALRQEVEELEQRLEAEEAEPELKEQVNVSILEYRRYAECTVSSTLQYCARLDLSIENTGREQIDVNPLQNSWLEDETGVQYSVVGTKDKLQYSGTTVYPESKRRGNIYYQPTVPVSVKALTLYVVVNRQVLNYTVF